MRVFAAGLAVSALVVMAWGCQGAAVEEAPMPAASAAAASSAELPRRPTRHHYLARTSERCEVYSVDHDVVSPAQRTPCPQDLQIGERIRVAGKTCLREGRVDRTQPVVCPGALIDADQKAREPRDGG